MKERLDRLLVIKGLAASRQQAQSLITAGLVSSKDKLLDKPGLSLPVDTELKIKPRGCEFVSRGGLKLAAALEHFAISPAGLVCIDIGASTGGFTDCLLQQNAKLVYAVDVGYGQLAWKLRNDPRVVVMERTNARHLSPADFPEKMALAVVDASFISLKLLLPPLTPLLEKEALIIVLIKPQFEVGKGQLGKGGIVKDDSQHQQVTEEIEIFIKALGLDWMGCISSPIFGAKGNREFLACIRKSSAPPPTLTTPPGKTA